MSHSAVNNEDPYKEIRPYRDDEVGQVLFDLLHDNEFVDAITQYQFPKMGVHQTIHCDLHGCIR